MANTLKGWLTDNTVTADPNDKILVLESTGKADMKKIYEEMLAKNTGLSAETLTHATTLFFRTCAQLLMNGYTLNTDLFQASPRFTGVVESGKWNPAKNNIYVSFTQDKVIREEIAKTSVHILGEKNDIMYILEVEDRKTGLKDRTATAGRNLIIRGASLKIAGTDEAVGITLRNLKDNTVVKLDEDMIAHNNPSELTLLMPADTADGNYELTVSTQYSNHYLLKTPRSASVNITFGQVSDGDKPEEL